MTNRKYTGPSTTIGDGVKYEYSVPELVEMLDEMDEPAYTDPGRMAFVALADGIEDRVPGLSEEIERIENADDEPAINYTSVLYTALTNLGVKV